MWENISKEENNGQHAKRIKITTFIFRQTIKTKDRGEPFQDRLYVETELARKSP